MRVSLILFFSISLFNSFSPETASKKINWLTWNEAIDAREKFIEVNKEAIAAQKLYPPKFFIDIYTDWCGWCKRMDATTFSDPAIVEYMNKNYFPVKLNAEMKDTIMYNNHAFVNPNPNGRRSTHTLAASLLDSRMSYPTYVILDENLSRTMIFPGYKQVEDLYGILLFYKTNQHLGYKNYVEKQYEAIKQREANK